MNVLKLIIMETSKTIEILNDLVQINNDRIKGYETALEELKPEDADLRPLFLNLIDESRQLKIALGHEVQVLGGSIDDSTRLSGKIYRAWMSVAAVFTGHDRHTEHLRRGRGRRRAEHRLHRSGQHGRPDGHAPGGLARRSDRLRRS